jgi:hypothetical protein
MQNRKTINAGKLAGFKEFRGALTSLDQGVMEYYLLHPSRYNKARNMM